MGPLFSLLTKIFKSATSRVAGSALVITVVMTALIIGILSFHGYNKPAGFQFILEIPPHDRLALAIFIFLIFVVSWFILNVLYTREARDIYSYLRDRLEGAWSVRYDTGDAKRSPFEASPTINCRIYINPDNQKLEMRFDLKDNPVWQDDDQPIKMVSLRHEADNRYTMMYYYNGNRKLQPVVSQHLISEEEDDHILAVNVEIFAILSFEQRTEENKITKLDGEWFDLNGNVIRILSLLTEIGQAAEEGKILRKKFSDAAIHAGNFAAAMGEVHFNRIT